ncbi:hypothetical protein NX059_008615 [Plenodomus lindquistii]|nr:hypothetical protein NX059_008615 [Plenodomus lindquistii]
MATLKATYTSPSTPHPQTISSTQDLPAITSPPSTTERIAYLAHLQTSLKHLQDQVNTFLTQKMADDKAAADDDARDEETYGEEVVDED